MITGPKYKICKRLGGAVFAKCQTQKYALSEARSQKGKRGGRRPSMSDYKRQLLEKQKMRYTYGVSEKQLSRYVREAVEKSAEPMTALVVRLESRLDNVVYRLGLAKTRRAARQLVSHGHITVGGRKVTIPSYQVKKGEEIAVREGSKERTPFQVLGEEHESASVPAWLSFDIKKLTGSVSGAPTFNAAELLFDPEQVLEYYSR